MQVMKKTYAKTVDAKGIEQLFVSAEKSDIEIVAWDKDLIKYEVIVSTKHPLKQQVLDDYESLKFLEQKIGKVLYLRTFLSMPKVEQKPKASFEILYKISCPKRLKLDVANSFGKIDISNTENELKGDLKFCKTDINGIKGKIGLSTKYGELAIKECGNLLEINALHTKMDIQSIKGEVKIDCEYGNLFLSPSYQLLGLKLAANKTEVEISMLSSMPYRYKINEESTKIELPKSIPKIFGNGQKNSYAAGNKNLKPIEVNMYFGALKIRTINK